MLKQEVINEMRVLPEIDAELEIQRRTQFIKNQLTDSGLTTLVLGISGGIDSCTLGRLAQLAVNELNEETNAAYRFIAVRLPYGVQADEQDAQASIDFIQPSVQMTANVKSAADAIHASAIEGLKAAGVDSFTDTHSDFVLGNAKARSRMAIQYDIAGLTQGLVLGTDHSAENITGFYTKFGDGACDLAPLFGLSKRQVRQLAQHMGAPEKVITKAPTADLESLTPQKSDEDSLGLTYDQIDDFLEGKSEDTVADDKLLAIYLKTQHKRVAIPTVYDSE
ncbi:MULTISPECIES: ammonia-dependent NAD(+) synthetase [Alteromonadaceae]|uniref:NH(3)-dependent NAD(+) synthetase n=1 Tax=Brumicola blandensis TaxID=3075611 RepID=A0AAW8R3T9_9ALTE|nr:MULTISPECIES: ammonia-dependent NAD(+) synthetase [unclassified Alteromonas]MDT0583947.1 ammonia-dependent NAD(+) synthetase [Alteromonas sp. W409]MDT0628860.1 ammonia-dependent NAD(+) synthetase [Alteromonas sp. W364]